MQIIIYYIRINLLINKISPHRIMIKKVINNKPPRLTSPRPNKNMFFSPLQGHNKNSSRKFKQQTPKNFNIKQNNISTSN